MWHSILPPVLAIRPAVFPFFMSPMSIQNTSTPPFKFTPASLGRVSEDQSFPISPEASIKHITSKFAQLRLLQNYADRSPLGFVCINNPVAARLQEGPTYATYSQEPETARNSAIATNSPCLPPIDADSYLCVWPLKYVDSFIKSIHKTC
jgi:hypothetical protein